MGCQKDYYLDELNATREENTELLQRVSTLNSRLQSLTTENSTLRNQISNLESVINQATKNINDLRDIIDTLEKRVAELELELARRIGLQNGYYLTNNTFDETLRILETNQIISESHNSDRIYFQIENDRFKHLGKVRRAGSKNSYASVDVVQIMPITGYLLQEGIQTRPGAIIKGYSSQKLKSNEIEISGLNKVDLTWVYTTTFFVCNLDSQGNENCGDVMTEITRVYEAEWVETLPYSTQYDFSSSSGYRSDPIYSKIQRNNFQSYVDAFIADANRHGLDLSHINTRSYDFFIDTQTTASAYAWNVCNDRISVGVRDHLWEYAITYDLRDDLIGIIWHELGHTILGLDHLCQGGQIMTGRWGRPKIFENQSECNSVNATVYNLRYSHSDSYYNWQRAVEDFFESYRQVYFQCRNSRIDHVICDF